MAKTNRTQTVMSESKWIKTGTYLTAKGKRLAKEGAGEEILSKYRKNKYILNPHSKPVKTIFHIPTKSNL